MTGKQSLLKTVSFMLLAAFVSQSISYAAEGTGTPFRLPSALAGSQVYRDEASPETIIHIQDAHDSLESQEKITDILETLVRDYQVREVALEGSSGAIDPLLFKTYPDQKTAADTAKQLLGEGLLNAGEFISIVSKQPIAVYGVEDRTLYRENLKVFRDLMRKSEGIAGNIEKLSDVTRSLGSKIYSEDTQALLEGFSSKSSDVRFADLAGLMEKQATSLKISLNDFPWFGKVRDILQLERSIDFKAANQERKKLLGALKDRCSKQVLDELVKRSALFRSGKLTDLEFHLFVTESAAAAEVPTVSYPALARYMDYLKAFEEIRLQELIAEMDDLREKLITLSGRDEEARFYHLSSKIGILKNLVTGAAGSEEYGKFLKDRPAFDLARLDRELLEFSKKYSVGDHSPALLKDLADVLPTAERFYRLAERRNQILVQNTLRQMRLRGEKVAALVTGGFHARGIGQALQDERLNCLAVMPKMTDENAKRPYVTVLTRKRAGYGQEFSQDAVRQKHKITLGTALDSMRANGYASAGAMVRALAAHGHVDEWMERYRHDFKGPKRSPLSPDNVQRLATASATKPAPRGARLAETKPAYGQAAHLWLTEGENKPVFSEGSDPRLIRALGDAVGLLEKEELAALRDDQKNNRLQRENGVWAEIPLSVIVNEDAESSARVTPSDIILNKDLLAAPSPVLTLVMLHALRRSLYRFSPETQPHDAEIFQKTVEFVAEHPDHRKAFLEWVATSKQKFFFGRDWFTPILHAPQITELEKRLRAERFPETGAVTYRSEGQRYFVYPLGDGLLKIVRIAPADVRDVLATQDASHSFIMNGERVDILRDVQGFAREVAEQLESQKQFEALYSRAREALSEGDVRHRGRLIDSLRSAAAHGHSGVIRDKAQDLIFSLSRTHPSYEVRRELNQVVFDLVTERPFDLGTSDYNYSAFSGTPFDLSITIPAGREGSDYRVRYSVNGGDTGEEKIDLVRNGEGALLEWTLPAAEGWVHYIVEEKDPLTLRWRPVDSDKARGIIKFQSDVRGKRVLGLRPQVFNQRLTPEGLPKVDEYGNQEIGTLDDIIAQLDSIKQHGFNEIYLEVLETGAPGDAGPTASPFSVLNPSLISERIGGLTKLLELKEKAAALGIEISLDMVPHSSISDRESSPRQNAWIHNAHADKLVRRAATPADETGVEWMDSKARNWADPRNVRDYTDELTKLALLGFNFRIDVGHVFDTTFPPDAQSAGLARLRGEVVSAERDGAVFKTNDLRNERDVPDTVLSAVIYQVKKRALERGIHTKFYSENWHGKEGRLILSGVDAPFNPIVRNLWEIFRDERLSERFTRTLRYLDDVQNRFGGVTTTVINNQDAEVPPVDAFGDRAFAATASAIFSNASLFQYTHYSFRREDGSVDWENALSEVWQIPVNNTGGPAVVNGHFWPGFSYQEKIRLTHEAMQRNQFLGGLGEFEDAMHRLASKHPEARVIGLDVAHSRVIGVARVSPGGTLIGFFHQGSPYAADINFHPNDSRQDGRGLGEFDPDSVWTLEQVLNNEKSKVSEAEPGDRLVFTGRELTNLGMGPIEPLPILGIQVYRFKKVADEIPSTADADYRALLRDSLRRYRRYGPRDRFTHSFVAREIVRTLNSSEEEFTRLFAMLTSIVSEDNEDLAVSDLSIIFGELLEYEPAMKAILEEKLIHTAVAAQTKDPLQSEIAIKILESAEVGEVVLVAPEAGEVVTAGGLGTYVSDMARQLARLGIPTTMIVPLYSDNKAEVFQRYHPYDTGRTVNVKFNADGSETQVVKIYEKRIDSVRFVFLENERYFPRLVGRHAGDDSAYNGDTRFRLRFVRLLSVASLKAIIERNIHPRTLMTNDWTTGLVKLYLEGRERRVDPGEFDLAGDPHLANVKVLHVNHNLNKNYQGKAGSSGQWEMDSRIANDLRLSPTEDGPVLSLGAPGEFTLNFTATANVLSDMSVAVSEGHLLRSIDPARTDEFNGLTGILQDKYGRGLYQGISNGTDMVGRQRKFLSDALRDPEIRASFRQQSGLVARSFAEIGREEDRRRLADFIFNNVTPVMKSRLQKSFGLSEDRGSFVYSMLGRISAQKGHQLLLGNIWNAERPGELKVLDGLFDRPEFTQTLGEEEQAALLDFAQKNGLQNLRAMEVALVLEPSLQFVIAGPTYPGSYYDKGFKQVAGDDSAPKFPGRLAYRPGFLSNKDVRHGLIFSGSTLFGMPSLFEPKGLVQMEAASLGVPRQLTRRDGLVDDIVDVDGFSEGFDDFNPVAWLDSLRNAVTFKTEHPADWDELRYQVITQDNRWISRTRNYIDLFRKMSGYEVPVELPALQVSAAVHRALMRGEDPSDELMKTGFTVEEAKGILERGLSVSEDPALKRAIQEFLPSLVSGARLAEENDSQWLSQNTPELAGKNIVEVTMEMALSAPMLALLEKKLAADTSLTDEQREQELRKAAMSTSVGGIGPLLKERDIALAGLGANVIGISLLYDHVWVQKTLPDGTLDQVKESVTPHLKQILEPRGEMLISMYDGIPVKVKVWKAPAGTYGKAEIYFLEVPEMTETIGGRAMAIYAGKKDVGALQKDTVEFNQRWLLGRGALALVKSLGRSPDLMVMSETAAMFAHHRVFQDVYSSDPFFDKTHYVFNDHTPLAYAHPKFDRETLKRLKVNPQYYDAASLASDEKSIPVWDETTGKVDMTALIINASDIVYGVAAKHARVMRAMPGLEPYADKIAFVTNGVSAAYWPQDDFRDPALVPIMDDAKVLDIKRVQRERLIRWIAHRQNLGEDWAERMIRAGNPIGVWTRRIVEYKRLERVADLLENDSMRQGFLDSGVVLIVGGRVHQDDGYGYSQYSRLQKAVARDPRLKERLIFFENYNIWEAPRLFQGADFSIMLADDGREASATGFQKAQMNGALVIASEDGAVPESVEFFNGTNAASANGFNVPYDRQGQPTAEGFLRALKEFARVYADKPALAQMVRNAVGRTDFVSVDRTAREMLTLFNEGLKDIRREQEDLDEGRHLAAGAFARAGITKNSASRALARLNQNPSRFVWKYKKTGQKSVTLLESAPGVHGLIDSFRLIRHLGSVGQWSLRSHAQNHDGRGDILTHISDKLLYGVPYLKQLRVEIEKLAVRHRSTSDLAEKMRINRVAISLVQYFVRHLETLADARSLVWWQDPREAHRVMSVPIGALRRDKNDPGIGKFTDLAPYFTRQLLSDGMDVVQLMPHYAALGESPYAPVSLYALNEDYIDWAAAAGLVRAGPETRLWLSENLVASSKEGAAIDLAALQVRENPASVKVFEEFIRAADENTRSLLADFESFKARNASWLDDYAEYMHARRPIGTVELYRFRQWVAYRQFKEAVDGVHRSGGKVLFDVPMFRAKDSVDVKKHPEYFLDVESRNPGIVNQYTHEDWKDLALWNWTRSKEDGFRFQTHPIGHWLAFGLDGARNDALHFAFDFKEKGQRASGDEPGGDYLEAVAEVFGRSDALPLAEFFEFQHERATQYGFVLQGGNLQTMGTVDDPRSARTQEQFIHSFDNLLYSSAYSRDSARFIHMTLGDQWGDTVPVKETRDGLSYFRYRIPLASDDDYSQRVRFKGGDPGYHMYRVAAAYDRLLRTDYAEAVWDDPDAIRIALEKAAALFVKQDPPRILASSLDWFQEEWGRDTFIALPGLLLSTGRFEEAKALIRRFAGLERGGIIPNRLQDPARTDGADYNTVDGSLWFIDAVKRTVESSGDRDFEREMLPVIGRILSKYESGTSYRRHDRDNRIFMDKDGLVVSPSQATWMDADPGGRDNPVTPRNGKAVEINVLWYAGLKYYADLLSRSGQAEAPMRIRSLAENTKKSFNEKFWNEDGQALYDVIEGDVRRNAIRPNMLYAVSHGEDLLSPERRAKVLDAATRELWTPFGLRTLSSKDAAYIGRYNTGDPQDVKDKAYHQGTVWPWLIGSYVDALVRVRTEEGRSAGLIQQEIRQVLTPLTVYLMTNPYHSLPEVFDGDTAKFLGDTVQRPGGTRSQAWSVAELNRVLTQQGLVSGARLSDEDALNVEAKARLIDFLNGADIKDRPGLNAILEGQKALSDFPVSERTALIEGIFELLPQIAPLSMADLKAKSDREALLDIQLHSFHPSFGFPLNDLKVDSPETPRAALWTVSNVLRDPFFFQTLKDRDEKLKGRMIIEDHLVVDTDVDLKEVLGDRYETLLQRFKTGRIHVAWGGSMGSVYEEIALKYEKDYVLFVDREEGQVLQPDPSLRLLLIRGPYPLAADKVVAAILAKPGLGEIPPIKGLQRKGSVYLYSPVTPIDYERIFRRYYETLKANAQAA